MDIQGKQICAATEESAMHLDDVSARRKVGRQLLAEIFVLLKLCEVRVLNQHTHCVVPSFLGYDCFEPLFDLSIPLTNTHKKNKKTDSKTSFTRQTCYT